MDGLGLKALRLVAVHEPDALAMVKSDRKRRFEVEPTFDPRRCPSCKSEKLYRHGIREQKYADVPSQGEAAVLLVQRRRWRCTECATVFPDPLPDMDETRHATRRLVEYVGKRSLEHTFESVARDVGLSGPAVRDMFDDMVARFEAKYRFVTPTVLGIDELKILGTYRCILTNIEKNTVYDILPARKLDVLRKYFPTMENKEQVRYVVADFYAGYATVAGEFFPSAKLIIDRFHVQRMGSNGIEAFRKEYRKSLTAKQRIDLKNDRFLLLAHGTRLDDLKMDELKAVLANHPKMLWAWLIKEKFHDVWGTTDRHEANQRMDEWLLCVPPEMERFFKEPMSVFNTRRPHILNYFDKPVTNAYTESINRLGKSINRMGRGYTLEVIRAKMLYDPRVIERGAVQLREKRPKQSLDGSLSLSFATPGSIAEGSDQNRAANKLFYGAHIPTLCDLLDSGEFE